MQCSWLALLLVSCTLVGAEGKEGGQLEPVATIRTPPRTLDRRPNELAWFPSPDNSDLNAPPRRITTKSLFITPLVCPKGQRLDRHECVEIVTVHKSENEQILLDQLNAFFTPAPSNRDVVYDYGDEEPGPLQLSIPIGLDPQAAQLQQEPSAQAQDLQPSFIKVDNKGNSISNGASSIETELELLKLQQAQSALNDTATSILSHNIMNNLLAHSDKPKRDSPMVNASDIDSFNTTDEGQKEKVYGHVSVDPVIYDEENHYQPSVNDQVNISRETIINSTMSSSSQSNSNPDENTPNISNKGNADIKSYTSNNKDRDEIKLNPENDYSDIGEAIKLISRYAEVSTDDNFSKDKMKSSEDSILGTRTKLQYRRNKPKPMETLTAQGLPDTNIEEADEKSSKPTYGLKSSTYYRYPWSSEHPKTPPANYPFHHLQDYWRGRNQVGGVYGPMHENPTRHHHTYPHYFRPRSYPYAINPNNYQELQATYQRYLQKLAERNSSPIRNHGSNQDLYSLLGLRHWFSDEDASKR